MTDAARRELMRLRWRCRRGMRELDGVLEGFLHDELASLGAEERSSFEALLELPDPELYGYLAGRNVPHDSRLATLVERIRSRHEPRT